MCPSGLTYVGAENNQIFLIISHGDNEIWELASEDCHVIG